MVSNIYTNRWGQIEGLYNGRRVLFTWSVKMWYFADTGEYIAYSR